MEYPDSFAGLAEALVDSGVDPEMLMWLESLDVDNISAAAHALEAGRLPPELSGSVQALLTFALGPDVVKRGEKSMSEAPPAKLRRTDLPVAKPTAAGSLAKALESARPSAREATLASFKRDVWAPSNQKPQASRWRTWSKVCDAWGIPALPLSRDGIEKVAASFKAGGYRSARQYFARARREHVLQMKAEVPPDVLLCMRDALRSLERGIGGPALKDAFRFEEVVLPSPFEEIPSTRRQAVCMLVLGCWFLLREIEIAALQSKHLTVDCERMEVTLTLAASKCDQQGNLVLRKHGCYCDHVPARMCPYHNAVAFEKIRPKNLEAPLFLSSRGHELSKHETIQLIRRTLSASPFAMKRAGAQGQAMLERFNGHVLRVSGAQFLARRLVPLPTIMLLGRWGSRSVERYVQEAALETFSLDQIFDPSVHVAEPAKKKRDQLNCEAVGDSLAALTEKLEILAARVEALQERPPLVVGKKAHARDPHELDKLPVTWRTRCGLWQYGCAAFTRASEAPVATRCRRCFPECAEDGEIDSNREESGSNTSSDSSSSDSETD
ncbi:unnamed protein product [Symbiodinium natans]|uniref:Uncharacterized protein n=1 Tax=Symbiodinium natans TaxID=878477 RepID=A0A812JW74_9DINO|nr:unnamed protein product [Symbiodinium natans]CAE7215155.1 unnamed protein product [Symbiodinium natans]